MTVQLRQPTAVRAEKGNKTVRGLEAKSQTGSVWWEEEKMEGEDFGCVKVDVWEGMDLASGRPHHWKS